MPKGEKSPETILETAQHIGALAAHLEVQQKYLTTLPSRYVAMRFGLERLQDIATYAANAARYLGVEAVENGTLMPVELAAALKVTSSVVEEWLTESD